MGTAPTVTAVAVPPTGGAAMTDDDHRELPGSSRLYATLVGITEQLLTHQLPTGVLAPLVETDDGIQLVAATRYGPDVVSATADALTLYTRHPDDGPPHGPLATALRRTAARLAATDDHHHVQLGIALTAAVNAAVAGKTVQPRRLDPGGSGA